MSGATLILSLEDNIRNVSRGRYFGSDAGHRDILLDRNKDAGVSPLQVCFDFDADESTARVILLYKISQNPQPTVLDVTARNGLPISSIGRVKDEHLKIKLEENATSELYPDNNGVDGLFDGSVAVPVEVARLINLLESSALDPVYQQPTKDRACEPRARGSGRGRIRQEMFHNDCTCSCYGTSGEGSLLEVGDEDHNHIRGTPACSRCLRASCALDFSLQRDVVSYQPSFLLLKFRPLNGG